jgi:hypothetical protein
LRLQIAQQAARLIIESGMRDYARAKRKAAAHLHAEQTRNLPTNQEIEQAIKDHQRLFNAKRQQQTLLELRQHAMEAMRLLKEFTPRLVGAVLSGTADRHSPITLHLFARTAEEVDLFLQEHNIPCELNEHLLKFPDGRSGSFPRFRFIAGQTRIELTVFPERGLHHPPLNPADGKPFQRADLKQLYRLNEAALQAGEVDTYGLG